MRRPDRRPAHREGVAIVELAVVLPFLCFLFVVALDYARIFYYGMTLENAARSGAYFASNYPGLYGYTNVNQAALEDATNLSPAPTVTTMYSANSTGPFNSATPIPNGHVEVTVSWNFGSITSYPGIPQSTTLTRKCRMRVAPIVPSFGG